MIKKILNKRVLIVVIGLTGFLFVSTNVVLASLLQDRIYPGVKVGSLDLGGLTRSEALKLLRAQVRAYHLSLVVDNVKYRVKLGDLGASYDPALTASQAFAVGRNEVLPVIGLIDSSRRKPLVLAYSIDRVVLAKFTSTFVSQQSAAPVDAAIVIKNGIATVEPDKPGLGVNIEALVAALEESVGSNVEQLTIQRGPVPADVQAAEAQTVAEATKSLIGTSVKLVYGEKTFIPSLAQVGSWITFSKQLNGGLIPAVDSGRVNDYLKTIAPQVEVAAISKKISVVNGEVKAEEGGVDGTAIDKASLSAQIIAAVTAAKGSTITIPMVVVAFKTQYNRTVSLDAPKYIEINLSSQRLWAYQDHKVAYESQVTSGATGYGFPTVTGLFSIYAKQTNRYLDGRPLGYNYNVFVQFWMPFHTDYGLHDASWRNGVFGGQDYYYNGSHGCVNLPIATASWLYNWAPIGTPVWVHL